jgi:superfamily II DNA or RNA helicase
VTRPKHTSPDQLVLGLPEVGRPWPDAARFPHNAEENEVGRQLLTDLMVGDGPLLISGYASVERLLGLLEALGPSLRAALPTRGARVLIGVEPAASARRVPAGDTGRVQHMRREVSDYWLSQGVSVTQWRALLAAVDLLREGRVAVRTSGAQRVHAKIYVSDRAATLGSSNFTESGLSRNLEGNVRFTRDGDRERYSETVDLAENLWSLAADYTAGFLELLSGLLQKVGWREALARACAEVLEGDWASRAWADGTDADELWPSQRHGIAQALWILENIGSVLIADATGAGKTRMGAHLIRALRERNWRTGRSPSRYPMLVCPPAVRERWLGELVAAGESVDVRSHGVLSRKSARGRSVVERGLEKTQLLAVDEAHNFLNRGSVRSRLLYGNGADHVILLTATPINRGASDLLSIVDLLGADNFDEDVLDIVKGLGRARGSSAMGPAERERLRVALQRFVVRRTKRDFNELIDREPERYRNALGALCRFPAHEPRTFEREDPSGDRALALGIRTRARNLRGLVNLRRLEMPRFLRLEGWSEERFRDMRLKGAQALASYQVRSRLRSSRAALVEHLVGTDVAAGRFAIDRAKSNPTGDIVGTLRAARDQLPVNRLAVPLPAWLTDPGAYREAIDEEIRVYQGVLDLVGRMTDHRSEANARYLLTLLEHHDRILAFDSHVISLHELEGRLRSLGAADVAVATGEGGLPKRLEFAERFGLAASEASAGSGLIGLCSDALAEGLNLQGASAVVHLDLPTVIRVLEQRIGRVDRMDSPHARVEVHWPREPSEFQLRSDDRLLLRLRQVEDLLGSNVPLPEELVHYEARSPDAELPLEVVIDAVERSLTDGSDVDLADAFARVRGLVAGDDTLIPIATYEALRRTDARVLSSVSVVRAASPWVFLAVGAADRGVPRWLLVDVPPSGSPRVTGDLDEVATALRDRLTGAPEDLDFDEPSAGLVRTALTAAREHQRELLPRRKQRALAEMGQVLRSYATRASPDDPERATLLGEILQALDASAAVEVDIERLAEWWLQIVRPEWMDHLARPRIRRPALLAHLRRRLVDDEISTERLATIRQVSLEQVPLERRVVAAIVGRVPVRRTPGP